jgi:hypothetical protein
MTAALFALPRDTAARFAPRPEDVNRDGARRAVRAGLADVFGDRVIRPYPYRSGHRVFQLTERSAAGLAKAEVDLLIEAADEPRGLIVLASHPLARRHAATLARLGYVASGPFVAAYELALGAAAREDWDRRRKELDDGSIADVQARTCRPAEDREVSHLLAELQSRAAPPAFLVPGSRVDRRTPGQFLVARAANGAPVALFQLADAPEQESATAELSIMCAIGGEREHALSLCLALDHLRRSGVKRVLAYTTGGEFGRELVGFGAELLPLRVHLRARRHSRSG